jgi:hypothetical protein
LSYAIMPYAVDLAKLRSLLGSGDAKVLAGIRGDRRFGHDFDGVDELGDDTAVSARTALEQMIMGGDYDADAGYVYGYCWKILCEAYGRWLPNEHWSAMRFSWFDAVNDGLRAADVKFSPEDLIYGGAGVPLPSIDDFPAIGHVERGDMPALLATLEGIDDAAITDGDVLDAVREIQGWLQHCVTHERDLVCFYH